MENGIFGTVIDLDDPKRIGRIKVKVNGYYDAIADDIIPWAIPKNIAFNRLDMPPIGSVVQVDFIEGEIMLPCWHTHNGKSADEMGIEEDQYKKSAVLLYKDLTEYESEGIVRVMFTESDGLTLEYKKGEEVSHMQLRADNTVMFKNSQFDKVVHISNESISLGTEGVSDEPATLGQTNHDALDKTNETIRKLSTIVEGYADEMMKICLKSSILTPLVSPNISLKSDLSSDISSGKCDENKEFYPKTKSEIVSLD